jgi:acetyl-CoA C-acetyltransferase
VTRAGNRGATPRIPVIIGAGEIRDRPSNTDDGLSPLEMLVRCAQLAEADVNVRCLRRVDTIRVVQQISWPYSDLPGTLARRLRLRGVEALYGPVGGESPVRMLLDSAIEIAAGESEIALVCGAEAIKSVMTCRMQGRKPRWEDEDPNVKLPRAEDYVTPYAARYGLINPVDIYPLYENAIRAAWGQSFSAAQRESGELWADMARVAAQNPYAWSGKALDIDSIINPSPINRPIAFPYQKFMVAQIGVNQGAAVLITHLEMAKALGITEDRLVFVGSGAGAHEPHDLLARKSYHETPAIEAVLRATLEANALSTADLDLYELYSCFPCVPKLACRALGLPASISPSVTGGLTFFGGPGNGYMTHAIAAMVRALRAGRGRHGLLYGNGEFLTKHHALVLSHTPPASTPRNLELQPQVDAAYGTVPRLIDQYEGACSIETFTASYTGQGRPDRATVIGRTPGGERFLARVAGADALTLAALVSGEDVIGREAFAYDGRDGLVHLSLHSPARISSASELPLQWSVVDRHVAVITLNRPDKRNAINGAVTRLLADYLQRVETDADIRVAILTANGGIFCGGADLAEVAAGHANDMVHPTHGFAGFVNASRSKPWIAAVRGSAVGGGTEIVLACDLVVAGESAAFGLPEVQRGLLAAAGGAYRLSRAIPPRRAMELLLTGDRLGAGGALELSLVNRVVADASVLDESLALARRIASNAPLAVQASRRIAAAALEDSDAALSQRSLEAIAGLMNGEDAKEGVRAFLEKRLPMWTGR